VPLLVAGSQGSLADYVCIERLSPRVILAYWLGTDRRCNLTAIQSSKGLAIVDTEMSPRIMAPIKQRIEQIFGRNDWIYVINTHAHDNHAGGNSLFQGATIVGHENLAEDMQWLIDKQAQPDWKRRDLDGMALTIRNLTTMCDLGYRYGVPVMGVTAVGKEMTRDARYFSMASRVCAENGASIVKTYFCEGFEKVAACCPVPIVIAGGKKVPEAEALEFAYQAIQSGANGVDMGRNVFQSDAPAAMIQAIRAVVHEGAKPKDAFDLFNTLKNQK